MANWSIGDMIALVAWKDRWPTYVQLATFSSIYSNSMADGRVRKGRDMEQTKKAEKARRFTGLYFTWRRARVYWKWIMRRWALSCGGTLTLPARNVLSLALSIKLDEDIVGIRLRGLHRAPLHVPAWGMTAYKPTRRSPIYSKRPIITINLQWSRIGIY